MKFLVAFLAAALPTLPGCSNNPPPGYVCGTFPGLSTERSTALSLANLKSVAAGKFVVLLKRPTSIASMGVSARQASILSFARSIQGLKAVKPYVNTLHGFSAEIAEPAKVIALLLSRNEIRAVYPVTPMRVEPFEAPAAVSSWGLDRVDQRDLPLDDKYEPGSDGEGVHVGILDTGILPEHPDYAGRVEPEFFDHAGGGAQDDHGHGTHVAGTVAGTKYGIAKQARLVSLKVLTGGTGDTAGVIAGVDYFTGLCEEKGWVCVGNASLGGNRDQPTNEAFCASIDKGVTWSLAAGNDSGFACGKSPSSVLKAVVVGATHRADGRASFSNYGQCVSLFAPGQDITSSWKGGGQNTISGTSMATPHVTGVLALILGEDPSLTPAEAKTKLLEWATDGKVGDAGSGSPNELLYYKKQ